MNKLFSKIAALSVGLAMAVGVGVAVNAGSSKVEEVKAASVTLTPADFEGKWTGDQASQSGTVNGFTLQSTSGMWNSAHLRHYAGATLTLSSSVGNMTSVVFTCTANGTANYGPGKMSGNGYVASSGKTGTWTGNAASFTLTGGQSRITSIEITYSQSTTPSVGLDDNNFWLINGGESKQLTATYYNFSSTPTLTVSETPSYVNVQINGNSITVSPKALGSEKVTLTATYQSEVATVDFDVVVYDSHGLVPDDPFDVAEARAAIDAGGPLESVYVTGIISQIDKISSGKIQYWISDDGTTSNQFEIYLGKGLNNESFSDISDIELGATIVNYGNIKKYNSTYEFDNGSYLISYVAPVVERELVSISVADPKVSYVVGDEFVKPVVTAHYDDEYSKPVTDSAVFSGYDLSVAGEQTVEVSYTENEVTKGTSYTITVTAPVTATYRRLTVSLVDYTGDYLIVCEDEALGDSPVAFDGSLDTLDAVSNNVTVAINDDTIELADTHEFHVAKKDNGFSIQSDSGMYIGRTANSNGLDSNASDNYTNSISYSDGVMNVVGSGGAYMRFNAASNQNRFRFFASGSYSNQKAISLFMKVSPAESLALDILNDTNATCAAYVDGETHYDKTTFADAWTALALKYNALDPEDQAVLVGADADKNGVMLEEAMARYDFLCAKYGLDNFMTGRTLSYAVTAPHFTVETNSNNMMIIIVVISSVTVLSLGVLIALKKKKHN